MADGGSTAIVGEVYRVPPAMMIELDRYEGPEYRRIEIALDAGPAAVAEAYVMPAAVAAGRPIIASGDWRDR